MRISRKNGVVVEKRNSHVVRTFQERKRVTVPQKLGIGNKLLDIFKEFTGLVRFDHGDSKLLHFL